jgi:glycosyltransferase involved in cell wall biosynthesis
MGLIVGIDASRNRSGGAKVHMAGLLNEGDPARFGIDKVHVWSYASLLASLPDAPWLIKHNPPELERSLPHQVWWQYRSLPREARSLGCRVLLNTDAGSICPFEPAVVMSRDMLSYEDGEMDRFRFTRAWVRLWLLKYIQAYSMRRAKGVVFLTGHAAKVIQRTTGPLSNIRMIPHGVGESFRLPAGGAPPDRPEGRAVRCLYVSNAALHKHQWHVIRAFGHLRRQGLDVRLVLAGGGKGEPLRRMEEAIRETDPRGEFVEVHPAIPHREFPGHLAQADIFLFASSCENMPNTLVEAMAAGLPIACSDRGPMPEVLRDGGVYFDPEDPASIAGAVDRLIKDPELRRRIAGRARELSQAFSWARCASETWGYLAEFGGG